jgi:methylenetetrahydrofolate dehydrogenase (NADP+)/methenyltetrahydrofolate cyclohydrolase
MAEAQIIDGKAIAEKLRARVARRVQQAKREHGFTPGLAVILVGEDPASQVYVRNKGKATEEVGMRSFSHQLPAETGEDALLSLIDRLNTADAVDGILVQLPLPAQISTPKVLERLLPEKDVDGFHPINAGRLSSGQPALTACTPVGCLILIKTVIADLSGANAVVIGRSNIVGKPVAQLLLAENATVTIAHSRTHDLPAVARSADILVAAVGRPELVRGDWIKPGALVIDVGVNRVPAPEKGAGKTRLVGDVAFAEARQIAGAITPVPGGVGPMTIACLMLNTLRAAHLRRGLTPPAAEAGL